ncbi:molybdopterin cofactor-binding domain-containing protein, partial [Zhongshania sp.]|uniref:molybdopterin cofactor-binding domain-containing protein n=1 Tax=Zhongshania sp. TaxID=1971902 RepID=UPI00356A630E
TAQVVNVSIVDGKIKVHKVVCAVECGMAINPDIVTMQMESGIVFGLTAALKGEITVEDGAVQQSNVHDYEMLRMNESPDIEIYRVDSANAPTGVGEPGVPPLAPALANAVFAASGQRLRQLPLRLG